MDLSSMQGLMVVVGPILLAVALAYALFANKKKDTPRDVARTEAATRDLYEKQDRQDKAQDSAA